MLNRIILTCVVFGIVFSLPLSAEPVSQKNKTLHPIMVSAPPKIDGSLDDPLWSRPADVDEVFLSFDPASLEPMPQKTKIWMAYDSENLYFAFYCQDSNPKKIKASIAKHDNLGGDDWIGVVIDTIGVRQFGYTLLVNPSGIQADMYLNAHGNTDSAPDWVWYSGGKIVKDGYTVEVRMPLASFRYKSGENVEMNILFARFVSRLSMNASWPVIKPGTSPLGASTKVIYGKLDDQLKLEILPSATYGSIWDREAPDKWSNADTSPDFGFSAKYGVTSTITAEMTYNPDFNQVESDSFQVLVNQRYPNFYTEKRPFFMESSNRFLLAGTGPGDYNMYYTVHTRRIVDPNWGFKLNGESGRFAFGLMAAGDEWPGRAYDDNDPNPFENSNATYLIGRGKYVIGKESYVGALFTYRDFGNGHNSVIGGDALFRLGSHSLQGNFLYSDSIPDDVVEGSKGSAWTLKYGYDTKPLGANIYWEHLDEDFRMDTAFFQRKGIDKITAYVGPRLYPEGEGWSWVKRINPFVWGYHLYDHETGENEYLYLLALRLNFIKQGFLRFDYRVFSNFWKDVRLEGDYFRVQGQIQWSNWLRTYSHIIIGDSSYYDADVPYVGDYLNFNIDMTIQPTGNLEQYFDYSYTRFDSKTDGSRVYDVNIFRSKTTYQINKHLFLRAILQYDSYREVFLTDLLASFMLIPGTVVHVGYGSLHQNLGWENGEWTDPRETAMYYQTTQSLFLKASYLFQF